MITAKRVRELFNYNPATGRLTRRIAVGSRGRKGDSPGTDNRNGYTRVIVDYKKYYAHRLAWLHVFGFMPTEIDHIDGDRTNNRINNLRPATRTQNMANSKRPKSSSRSPRGVYWVKANKNWKAVISINNRSVHLGTFLTPEEAQAAYAAAAKKHRGEFARY
jgi:hypothetical protein